MDKKLLGLVVVFFVIFILFTTAIIFQKPLTQAIRATEENTPSGASSLIFAWPLSEKADGVSQVKIDVFVRSKSNRLISKKTVKITTTLGNIQPVSSVSDDVGKTTFIITSSTPGVAELSAIIDNSITLQKTLSIKFE